MQLAVVAAGFTAGEADKLRRAMAAWKRRGGIEPFREKLIDGMLARGYQQQFAEQIFQQILGFGEYGFPESHAASFALLVYVSSWLKCHEPAAFACALLNSQPLGFYSVSSIVQDAQRHGVEVRPVDVMVSEVDSTLESLPREGGGPSSRCLRLGLSMVKGLKVDSAKRIVDARNISTFKSSEDLARRANLDRHDLSSLAAADALASLSGHRREALWETLAVDEPPGCAARRASVARPLSAPTEGEEIVADYQTDGPHAAAPPARAAARALRKRRIRTAEEVLGPRMASSSARAGIVTCRQRPATASGVIFVTLEDETGT
jgi:error-prone DNA polymerase